MTLLALRAPQMGELPGWESKAKNKQLQGDTSRADFVKFRTERDAQLKVPGLIIPSLQVNMRAGDMPPAEDNGEVYLKVPVNVL